MSGSAAAAPRAGRGRARAAAAPVIYKAKRGSKGRVRPSLGYICYCPGGAARIARTEAAQKRHGTFIATAPQHGAGKHVTLFSNRDVCDFSII
jgi:hypothetical protein